MDPPRAAVTGSEGHAPFEGCPAAAEEFPPLDAEAEVRSRPGREAIRCVAVPFKEVI